MAIDTTILNGASAETRTGTAGTILLVEDDPSVRGLVSRLLKLQGYTILVAENGRAALPVWDKNRDNIDLLLTDVVMPQGLSGRELATRCQAENPHLQVIYTSGYNVEMSTQHNWLKSGIQFVQKPYRPEQLLQAVRVAISQNQNH